MVNKIKHNWEFGLLHDKTNKIKGKEGKDKGVCQKKNSRVALSFSITTREQTETESIESHNREIPELLGWGVVCERETLEIESPFLILLHGVHPMLTVYKFEAQIATPSTSCAVVSIYHLRLEVTTYT